MRIESQIGTSRCRHCDSELSQTLVDLGSSPLCNTLLDDTTMLRGESFYPLHVRICGQCFLGQVGEFVTPDEIFSEYSYFSSFSTSFVKHAEDFAKGAIERFGLDQSSLVFEVASNDGYLLQHFVAAGVPVLGIEPALNVAQAARDKGVPTTSEFLGEETGQRIGQEHGRADLVVANNVLAHTPALNDFVTGLRTIVRDGGVVSIEAPHLLRLIDGNQFDTIYHEHFCYFSFYALERVLNSNGLTVFDVQEIPTHGGSLRVFATTEGASGREEQASVAALRQSEERWGVTDMSKYAAFSDKVAATKRDLLDCLIKMRRVGQTVVGYGAPGKGNTLLNYCGIRSDLLDYLVDRNPYKQGRYAPGTRIPILSPDRIQETKPDYLLLLPWNIKDELIQQNAGIRAWGGKFIVAIPDVNIID